MLICLYVQDTVEDVSVFEREVGIPRQQLCDNNWSIIIPTLNEGNNIQACLENVTKVW